MATGSTRQGEEAPVRERTPEEQAAVKAVSAWVNLLARSLKTCRLYDAGNPTVARFRDELAASLAHLTETCGSITFRFTADDMLYEDASMYLAKSREDNLALPFFRDGIHALTVHPGVERRESDAVLNALLKVTGQNVGDDDLVTLLWEAQLSHVEMEYVPSEGDLGVASGPEVASPVPWPAGNTPETSESGESGETGESGGTTLMPEDGAQAARSDDWSTGDTTVEVEAAFADLEALAPSGVQAFREARAKEQELPLVDTALAISNALLTAKLEQSDRDELSRFLPRALRESIGAGRWREASHTVDVLRRCQSREWTAETFTQELLQPVSIAAAVEKVDQQDSQQVREFVAFARELGEPAVDLLNQVLGESKVRRTRRVLAEAVTELCRNNPERLAPWLADPRWYVVRNIIHILGWIGGPQIVGLLQTAARHREPKVRYEVVAALAQMDLKHSRPLLIKMLDGADSRLFTLVLHQLSTRRDSATARLALGFLQDAKFDQRPIEEQRAIYSTLSATGNDEILPELEEELLKGNWFTRTQEFHRQAIARCIARLGTAAARTVLERGAQSKRGAVRKACEEALAGAAAPEPAAPARTPGTTEHDLGADDE